MSFSVDNISRPVSMAHLYLVWRK